MKKIPDRWGDYVALGKVIKGTRFVAFKVPLSEHLSQFLPEGISKFTPDILVDHVKEQGKELGLVIDLTNTTRYYQKHHLEKHNIRYEKIFTEGHVVPSLQVRKQFFGVVDNFLSSCQNEQRLIGVHCTHGLNRTGYMICRYMIDKMSINPEECIQAFNEARGHSMERQNYLDHLKQGQLPFVEDEEEDQPLAEAVSSRRFYDDSNHDRERRTEGFSWRDRGTPPKFSQSRGYGDVSFSPRGLKKRQPDRYYGGPSHPYHSQNYTPDKTEGFQRRRDHSDDVRRSNDRIHFNSRRQFSDFDNPYYDYNHYHLDDHPSNFGHYNHSYKSHGHDLHGNSWHDRGNHWHDRGSHWRDHGIQGSHWQDRGIRSSHWQDHGIRGSHWQDRGIHGNHFYGRDMLSDLSHGREMQSDPSHVRDVQSDPSHVRDVQSDPSHVRDVQSDPSHVRDVQSDPSHVRDMLSDPSHHDMQNNPSNGRDMQNDPSYGHDS